MIKNKYDVIVVGGGPAGSLSAWKAAEAGMSVLLLEKDREIGLPVRCGEGTGLEELKRFLPIDDRWISHQVKYLKMVAPDGTKVTIETTELGCILDRKRFDAELARRAGEAGAEVRTRAYVFGLEMSNKTVTGVKVVYQGQERTIDARIIIGADGVESRIGRMAGIRTFIPVRDINTCYQMVLANIDIEADSCEMHFGEKIAPGGYAWIFPKGERKANVGVGISSLDGSIGCACFYLELFIRNHFTNYTILSEIAGGVPCLPTLPQITAPGIMLVGDAARQVNPLTGGGIISAMTAGQIAGEVAANAIRRGDVSPKGLEDYPQRWEEADGKTHRRLYRIKKAVFKLNDHALNRTAHALMDCPPSDRNLMTLFRTALIKNPALLIDIVKVFA
jgi:digeranylgeranylglycerophospholipid reductase